MSKIKPTLLGAALFFLSLWLGSAILSVAEPFWISFATVVSMFAGMGVGVFIVAGEVFRSPDARRRRDI